MDPNCELHQRPSPPSAEEPQPRRTSIDIQFSLWHTFKHHIPRLLLTLLFDVVLPLVLFFVLQKRIKSVYALLISGTPPLLMVIVKAIISRTFDALGFLVFLAFLISGIVALVTHNDIILLLEKSLVTAVVSIVFAVTLIPCRCCKHRCVWRPLAYYFYQDLVPTERAQVGLPDSAFDHGSESVNDQCGEEGSTPKISRKKEVAQVYKWIYTHCPSFRRACYQITIVWSVGFLFEFVGRLVLILIHLTVGKIVIYGHVILTVITGTCILLTILFITIERKQTLEAIKQWKEKHRTVCQQEARRSQFPLWIMNNSFDTEKIEYT